MHLEYLYFFITPRMVLCFFLFFTRLFQSIPTGVAHCKSDICNRRAYSGPTFIPLITTGFAFAKKTLKQLKDYQKAQSLKSHSSALITKETILLHGLRDERDSIQNVVKLLSNTYETSYMVILTAHFVYRRRRRLFGHLWKTTTESLDDSEDGSLTLRTRSGDASTAIGLSTRTRL